MFDDERRPEAWRPDAYSPPPYNIATHLAHFTLTGRLNLYIVMNFPSAILIARGIRSAPSYMRVTTIVLPRRVNRGNNPRKEKRQISTRQPGLSGGEVISKVFAARAPHLPKNDRVSTSGF